MLLNDLVLQGVRKFVQSQRIPFKPGFNIIFGGTESGKTTLFDCVLELLFPNRLMDQKQNWKSWSGGEQSRAGLTLSNRGQVYRILKDFGQNKVSLSRRAPNADKFERLSLEVSEIASILAEEFGLINWDDYKTLFLESALYLPSYKGIEKSADKQSPAGSRDSGYLGEPDPGQMQTGQQLGPPQYPDMGQDFGFGGVTGPPAPGFGMPGMPGMGMPGMGMPGMGMPGDMDFEDGLNWQEKEKKLEKLKSEISRIKEIEDIQFEIDGLQSKMFDLSKEREKVKKLDQEIQGLEDELEKYRFFRGLPENIEMRIDGYASLEENKGRDLEGLDYKLAETDDEIRYLEMQPKFFEPMIFKVGAGIAGVGILAMLSHGLTKIPQPISGLLIVGGLGTLGYSLWQFLSGMNKLNEAKTSRARLEERRKTTAKDYDVKGAIVKRLLQQTNCDDTRELKEMLHTFQELDQQREEVNRRKKELMIDLDFDKLGLQETELKSKIAEQEQKLKGYAALGMDANETRREIERLEQSLNRARQLGLIGSKPAVPGTGVPTFTGPAQTRAPSPPAKDAGRTQVVSTSRVSLPFWDRILESAGRVLGAKTDDLLKQSSGRANLYLQAFSGKKYREFRKEKDTILVKLGDMEQELDVKEVGKTGTDMVYLSLKFALLEMLVDKLSFPVLIDEAYIAMDEARATAVAKTLKRVSQKTQVIVFTSQKLFVKEADNALSLG